MLKLRMSKTEKIELLVSWLTISVAFSILFGREFLNVGSFAVMLPISLLVVGTGFILHELSHKYVALHFGAWAEYRAWNIGLIIALASSFLGFIFAAPGAVYISGNISKKQNGIISVAGPITNIAIGLIFLAVAVIAKTGSLFHTIAFLGFKINFFLALFNMIPIFPLDGSKVFAWDNKIWALVFFPALAVVLLA